MFIDTKTFKKTERFPGTKASVEALMKAVVQHALTRHN
jgi:hypothetical protein